MAQEICARNDISFAGYDGKREAKSGGIAKSNQSVGKTTGRCAYAQHSAEHAHNLYQKKAWCQTVVLLVQLYSHYSVSYCCKLFGKSRQAFYGQIKAPDEKGL